MPRSLGPSVLGTGSPGTTVGTVRYSCPSPGEEAGAASLPDGYLRGTPGNLSGSQAPVDSETAG